MEGWKKNNRKEVVITDVEGIVPKDHLLRKIERIMDYERLYEADAAVLLRRQQTTRNKPGSVNQNGADSAFVWNPIAAANIPGDTGECGRPVTKTVSSTDPDCGMFVKSSHERQFAYEAHTACDQHGGTQYMTR